MIKYSYILVLSLLLSSYDYRIGQVMISELVNLGLFFIIMSRNYKLNITLFIFCLIVIVFYLLNGLMDAISGGLRNHELIGFMYKYLNIIITLYLFFQIPINTYLSKMIGLIILIFWSVWVFYEVINNPSATIFMGLGFPRPPREVIMVDSHLFGFLVGILGIFLYCTSNKHIEKFLYLVVIGFLILAIGARTPVALLGAACFFTFFLDAFLNFNLRRLLVLFIFSIFVIVLLLSIKGFAVDESYRAFQFRLDGSVLNRFNKLVLVVQNATDYLPVGFGFSRLSFEGRWVDGIIATLILDFGFYFGCLFVCLLVIFTLRASVYLVKEGHFYTCVAINYAVGAQFVTEYLLTSRGSILSIGFLCAIFTYEKKKVIE